MFVFCWCFFLRVSDEKNENATFLKHFRADIFEDANFPYSLAADVNGCVRNRDDVTFIWKIVSLSLIAFLRLVAFSTTSFFEKEHIRFRMKTTGILEDGA